jgi:nucleoside-diphosphate-sugar epimerase
MNCRRGLEGVNRMEGQKILVTGPAGHLTMPIVQELAANNEIWGLARFSNPADRQKLEVLGVRCVKKDIGCDRVDDLPDDFDYVFHAGAMVAMSSEEDMAYTFQVNVQGTSRLMERCRNVKTFVFCSTGGVYKHQTHPTKETDEYGAPIPAYSLSKIAAEQLVIYLSQLWNIPTIILRIGAVYGPEATGPLVRIERMVRGKEVWVNPTEPRQVSVMWVDDAVRLAIKAFDRGQVPPLITNFSGDDPVSIEDYCRYAAALLGVEPRFRYTEDTYPANRMDTTRMHEVLGRCEVGWREGFRRLIETKFPDALVRQPG